MNLNKYDCVADPKYETFFFDSIGPNGVIPKIVNFKHLPGFYFINGLPVINLAFGNYSETNNYIDDIAVSNNDDRNKILASVAFTVNTYFDQHEDVAIHAKGSTPARTRLYQMGINMHWDEINKSFIIYGFRQDTYWQEFRRGINYQAFIVVKKNS